MFPLRFRLMVIPLTEETKKNYSQLINEIFYGEFINLAKGQNNLHMKISKNKKLTAGEIKDLLAVLNLRFIKNIGRHKNIEWTAVQKKLEAHPEKCWSLNQMETTAGEPDVVGQDAKTKEFIFMDCAAESPAGRRSLCYDEAALNARKENKPKGSALGMAEEMGVSILTEDEYRSLQKLGSFDNKTSSWLQTTDEIRKLGGAIFGDFRFGKIFIYHNGVQSYYAGRAFRASLKV